MHTYMSKHQVVHLKHIQFLFVHSIPITPQREERTQTNPEGTPRWGRDLGLRLESWFPCLSAVHPWFVTLSDTYIKVIIVRFL